MRKWTLSLVLTWLITLLSVTAVIAQGSCSELIEQALEEVGENCEELDRNNACYGYDLVQASFLEEIPEDYFSNPADIASILDLETIATAALDEENGTWGVAVMNVQANIPNTIPGQNVIFILMGDTQVENGVAPEDIFQPSDGIEITVNASGGANIRSGPGLNFNVVGSAANAEVLLTDAQSEDGAWFRIPYRDRIAWINEVVLGDTSALADLPVITPELRTSMQAFYVQTGIGDTDCEEAPEDILIVQGPDNIEIELTINGANVEISSSIGIRTPVIDGEPFLEIMTYDGDVFVDGVRVPPTYRTLMCMEESDDERFEVACEPSTPEPVPEFGESWCILETIPANIVNYNFEILCPGEEPPAPAQPAATTVPSQPDTEPDTSPEEPAQPEVPGNTSQLPGVDCTSFRILGPFSGITPRPTLFSWTPAPGATDYQIVFYNVGDGVEAGYFWTTETQIGVHVSEVPTGGTLAYEIRAYANGAYACVTPRTPPIMRSVDPEEGNNNQGAGFSASLSCSRDARQNMNATVSWSGANPNDTVTATGQPVAGAVGLPQQTASGTGSSGSVVLNGTSGGITDINVSTTSGESRSLGSCQG